MKPDKNVFFREATLRLCGDLDIEIALFNLLEYLSLFMPASKVYITVFERSTWALKGILIVALEGEAQMVPPTSISRGAIQEMESVAAATGIRMWTPGENPSFAKALRPYIDIENHFRLTVKLALENDRLASFNVLAEDKAKFTKEHLGLVSSLQEPLSIAISNAIRYRELMDLKSTLDSENRELSRRLRLFRADEIIGAEAGLKAAMDLARQVAPLGSPVLLLGETGAGKEVIGDAIHHMSSRGGGPLVKVNCGAIPETLMDSELFGHERGAFTGAVVQKKGVFELADRGTIFLDEIGELSLQAQVRLLRALQYKEIQRVGGSKIIPVDVRVIAATHRNMEQLVQAGAFREDLWFRINVFPIYIPPLRQRKEDIPALVHYFIGIKSKDMKVYPAPSVSVEEIERLKDYNWPGNVRELENLVERELIHYRGKEKSGPLKFEHFEFLKTTYEPEAYRKTKDLNFPTLDQAVLRHIRQALQISDGKISGRRGAAELLGMAPSTLRARMRKLGFSFKSA